MDNTTVDASNDEKTELKWLTSDNVEKICRVCLRTEDLLLNLHNESFATRFTDCTQLQIEENDGLPPCLCQSCFNILSHFYNFKLLCYKSDAALRQHFFEKDPIKTEIIEVEEPELKNFGLQIEPPVNNNDNESFSSSPSKDRAPHFLFEPSVPKPSDSLENEIFTCKICPKSYKTYTGLNKHMVLHNQMKAFLEKRRSQNLIASNREPTEVQEDGKICKICNKKLKTSETLRVHMIIHSGEKKHKCSTCYKAFTHKNVLKAHELTHAGIKKYNCHLCGKKFIQSEGLKIHLRNHAGLRPYSCSQCDKRFARNGDLKRHSLRHGVKNFHCNVCSFSFFSKQERKKHMFSHSSVLPFGCEICGKGFTARSFLIVHKRSHTGERPYQCDFCQKTFLTNRYLTQHRMIHTGEKPHRCRFCSQAFIQKSALNRHVKSHNNGDEHASDEESTSDFIPEGTKSLKNVKDELII